MSDVAVKKILLVEDEAVIAMAESRMLERNGYKVLISYSGDSAIDTAQKQQPLDLVLMDIDLGGGMDGAQTARVLAASINVPILFLSGHTEPEIVEKTEGISCSGYVVKNSGETVLIASIKMALRLHELRMQNQNKNEELELTVKKLKKSEAEFRCLFEASPVAVGMLKNRCFVKINRVMCNLFGYTEAEMLNQSTRMLYESEEEFERLGRILYKELNADRYSVQETRLKCKNGKVLDVLISASQFAVDGDDSDVALATTVTDITEQKRLKADGKTS